jgi:CubicO group peptidase (beta-lactamase class C family)
MRLAALSLILAASLAATTPPKAAPPAKAAAPETKAPASPSSPDFPKSEAGGHAASWFQAFNAGETSMKRYIQAHVAPAALEKRTVGDRMEIYRDMKEERGKITALEVREFTDSSVKVIARGERGGRFQLTFLCEGDAPHRLLGIRVEDLPPEEGTPEAADDAEYSAAPAGPHWTAAQVTSALTATLDSLAHAGSFSGAVLLAKGDQVLHRQGYGLASRRFDTPNRPDTKFCLGSINKVFTRLAVEQLAKAGKLKLDDTIDRYLPGYPREVASKITIQMLIDHRAGVPDIFGPKYMTADRTQLRSVSDWVELIQDQPLRFEPGTREEYSNGGYVLLGAIVEKVSGNNYYDYVRERIFEPAGMKDTESYESDDPVANLASGYTRRLGGSSDGPWRDNETTRPGRGSPAGGGYSTVDDLFRFAQALRSGKLGEGVEGGIGIAGGAPGMNALLEMEDDWTLVVLANLDPPAAERVGTRMRGVFRRAGADHGGHEVKVGGGASNAGGPEVRRVVAARGERPGSTKLPASPVTVPMEWAGHVASVSVRLNGKGPFRFAIDTGAAGTARIDSSVARALNLPVVGEARVGDPSGKNAKSAPIVRLESLEIGGARFGDLTATTGAYAGRIPGEKVDGILGFALFADCLVTLDYPALRLTLASGELPPANGTDVIDFHGERGIPSITIKVADMEVEADVDAGAMGGISLPDALATKLPLAAPPRVVGHARTVSNEFDIKAAELKGNVILGGVTLERPQVEFQPIFPMANVGSRVLRNFALTFDQKNHRLRIARSA